MPKRAGRYKLAGTYASPPNPASNEASGQITLRQLPDGSMLGCNTHGMGGMMIAPNGHLTVWTENPQADGSSDGTVVVREGTVTKDAKGTNRMQVEPFGEAITPDGRVLDIRLQSDGSLASVADITRTPLGQQVTQAFPRLWKACKP